MGDRYWFYIAAYILTMRIEKLSQVKSEGSGGMPSMVYLWALSFIKAIVVSDTLTKSGSGNQGDCEE